MTKRDNTKATRANKVKRESDGKWAKGTPSPNPLGAPKRSTSMAEAYDWVLGMSPDAVADVLEINGKSELSRQFRQMPRGVQNQILLAMRVFAAAMFEPQAALLNHVIDRVDGPIKSIVKVEDDLTDDQRIEKLVAILDAARARRGGQADESDQDRA